MIKILVINGPNINMLGIREPDIYGVETYNMLIGKIKKFSDEKDVSFSFFQSNHEGKIIDRIQKAYRKYDGLIINPAAYTHTSIAIPDAIRAVNIPAVEVHISDVDNREDFRRVSYTRSACISCVSGLGTDGYCVAAQQLIDHINNRKNEG